MVDKTKNYDNEIKNEMNFNDNFLFIFEPLCDLKIQVIIILVLQINVIPVDTVYAV